MRSMAGPLDAKGRILPRQRLKLARRGFGEIAEKSLRSRDYKVRWRGADTVRQMPYSL
jgi:hypothetical protein